MEEKKDKLLLSSTDVADTLGVAEQTLRVWRHRKVGPPYFKLGGTIRYSSFDVDQYLEDSRRFPLNNV